MSAKIQLLSEQTINQIAAGEVIENPASVVKELIENSVDAGSKNIAIEIKGGGFQLIRISDDGCGMNEEDALLSFQRFATSKIRKLDDLSSLSTMGFRGEALAAIGAVSKISLLTAEENANAIEIELEAGKILQKKRGARTRGTTLEIRSLFYNVPARKKFQKSASASSAEITRMVTFLSLAHPEISFQLIQQEKELFSLPAVTEKELAVKIEEVLGKEFLVEHSKLHLEEEGFKITGVLGHPLQSRPNRTGQYLFINGRPVQSPLISYAIKEGYGTRIAEGRHPTFVLHFHLPHELLDVNVHPQKKEVRIREEQMVREKILRAISDALQGKKERSPFTYEESPPFSFTAPLFSDEPPFAFKFQERIPQPELEIPLDIPVQAYGVFSHYLLLNPVSLKERVKIEVREGIFLVDLQAAKSRLLFDLFMRTQGKIPSQGLIFPLTLNFSKAESGAISENLTTIQEMGVEIRSIGESSFIIEALPPLISEERVKDLISLFADEFAPSKRVVNENREKKMAQIAERFAAQDKKRITLDEALSLFEALLKTTSPYFSPSGKQTMLQVTCHEIAQLFASKKTT